MILRLKGELDPELTRIRLKPGQTIKNATSEKTSTMGQVYFYHYFEGINFQCLVWPDNYDVIREDKPVK